MGLDISYHKSWMCACLLTWEKYRACAASWGPRLGIKSPISTREPEARVIPQHLKNLNIHLCVRALIMSTQHSHLHCCNPTHKTHTLVTSTQQNIEVKWVHSGCFICYLPYTYFTLQNILLFPSACCLHTHLSVKKRNTHQLKYWLSVSFCSYDNLKTKMTFQQHMPLSQTSQ